MVSVSLFSRLTCCTVSSASSSDAGRRAPRASADLGDVAAAAVTLSGTPESGIIMMAGIYYGSMYGGSTTSILVNIPGEAASVVTCLDGHQMAKQGRAGPALGISALGSFIAGTFSLIALMLIAPSLANVAVAFGAAEYFSLMVLGSWC